MSLARRGLTALAGVALLFPLFTAPAHADASTEYVYIPVDEETELNAFVITPPGEGPHPLLVLPSSWSLHSIEYVGAGKRLAFESGYQVVSYTPRGWIDSGGEIEVAGPPDIADASAIIDWALENTEADPQAIGMAGISYGAGISVLAAAHDERIGAVGSLSGWADLEESLYPGETIDFQSVELLLATADLVGSPGEELRHVAESYRQGDIQPALDFSPERSPVTYLDQLNANDPAIMVAHAWNDGFFNVGHITDFYSRLETPKRLMVSTGDHATAEAFGALGLPNRTWQDLTRWFDHHLKGEDNGIAEEDAVHVRENRGNGAWASYPDWESLTADTEALYLSQPRRSISQWQQTGGMAEDPQTGWHYSIRTGIGTTAQSGTVLISGALLQFADIPTGVSLPLVNRYRAGVWTGDAYSEGLTVSGAPTVEITLTPTAQDTSLFFYLYSTTRHGTGALVTHKPHTLHDAEPGEPVTVEVDLEPVVRDVPAGHSLTLVIDTDDPRYTTESGIGEHVEFGSPDDAPAVLRVPTT
jgi:predicted acyl esterase